MRCSVFHTKHSVSYQTDNLHFRFDRQIKLSYAYRRFGIVHKTLLLCFMEFLELDNPRLLLYGKEQREHSAEHLPLCSTEKEKQQVWNIVTELNKDLGFCLPFQVLYIIAKKKKEKKKG